MHLQVGEACARLLFSTKKVYMLTCSNTCRTLTPKICLSSMTACIVSFCIVSYIFHTAHTHLLQVSLPHFFMLFLMFWPDTEIELVTSRPAVPIRCLVPLHRIMTRHGHMKCFAAATFSLQTVCVAEAPRPRLSLDRRRLESQQ